MYARNLCGRRVACRAVRPRVGASLRFWKKLCRFGGVALRLPGHPCACRVPSFPQGRVAVSRSVNLSAGDIPGRIPIFWAGCSTMNSQRWRSLWRRCAGGALAVLGVLFISGCGVSSASSSPVKVWGRVACGGHPVRGGTIVFMPTENLHSNWGIGQIDDQGIQPLNVPRQRHAQTGDLPHLYEAANEVRSPARKYKGAHAEGSEGAGRHG